MVLANLLGHAFQLAGSYSVNRKAVFYFYRYEK